MGSGVFVRGVESVLGDDRASLTGIEDAVEALTFK